MKIQIIGSTGILGTELVQILSTSKHQVVTPNSAELDLLNTNSIREVIHTFKPDFVINCAAWTDVDGAQSQSDAAFALNAEAVGELGRITQELNLPIVHISTDYVFNGKSLAPYTEKDATDPINAYGASKLKGEELLLKTNPENSWVIRTSWLYGQSGKNFVKSIARKALKNEAASVVNDQVGSPTNALDLAAGILSLVQKRPEPGLYNFSNQGAVSWYGFAEKIYQLIGADEVLLTPIMASDLNTKAPRPKNSVLSKEKWIKANISHVPDWDASLELALPEIVRKIRDEIAHE
jgi:dTDP-4-dehydrorhamnose reductase